MNLVRNFSQLDINPTSSEDLLLPVDDLEISSAVCLLLFIILNHNNFAINIYWMFRNSSIFHFIHIMNLVRNCSQLDINPTSIEDLFTASRWSGRFMAWWVGLVGVMSIKSGGCICCCCSLRTPMFYSTRFTYIDAIFKANQPKWKINLI